MMCYDVLRWAPYRIGLLSNSSLPVQHGLVRYQYHLHCTYPEYSLT